MPSINLARCTREFEDTGFLCGSELVTVNGDTFCPVCQLQDTLNKVLKERMDWVLAEREACAKIADDDGANARLHPQQTGNIGADAFTAGWNSTARRIADAIRARGGA